MRYKRFSSLLLAAALAAPAALAQTVAGPAAPDVERLRAHVSYLASEKLEGRRTGTPGAQEAALYVAREFMRLRLGPGGNTAAGDLSEKSYLQEFPYVASVSLGAGNALTATRRVEPGAQGTPLAIDFKVGEDWMPLGFGSNAKAEGGLVFVGYGITDAAQNYDDYGGAAVKDKVAVAFAGTPDGDNPHGRFARAGEARFKAAAARAAGARALVLIAAEEKFADDKLSRLRYDNSGGDAGLPVAVMSRRAAAKILGVFDAATLSNLEKNLGRWLLKVVEEVAKFQAGNPGGGTAVGYHLLLNPRAAARHDFGPQNPAFIEAPGVVVSLTTDVVRRNAPAANVVGVLEGSDPVLKSEVVVVGAHYDHLGRGGEGSGSLGREGDVHYGADDNASGTAGLLELARLFSREPGRMRRTVVFVAFGGEEEGLIGSSYYVRSPARPLGQTVAMLNMDMIGRLRGDVLNVGGVGTASEWRSIVEDENGGRGAAPAASLTGAPSEAEAGEAKGAAVTATPAERFALRLSEDGYGPSDHSAFYARRVPVLFFFTGSHEDYHKPTDTAERVNYEGEARVVAFVRDLVYRLQSRDRRPTYAVAKSEANARSTGFKVSLGTVPSYGDSADGLKLDGVREGSPAEAAGLKAGDKIVKLAGRDVRNVYDYTQALSGMKAGQEYEVEVMRDGRLLSMKITPAARK